MTAAAGAPVFPPLAAGVWEEPWAAWAVVVLVGFPLATILLGELADRFAGRPAEPVLRGVRNLVLPAAVLWVFLHHLLGVDEGVAEVALDPETNRRVRVPTLSVWSRSAISLLAAAALFVGLGAANAAVLTAANRATTRPRVPKLFLDLIRAFLVLIGAAVIASVVWEQDLGGLLAALGVGSIVIGLALQDTLGNLMSGIAILFERPFNVGGWLRVGDGGPEGKVLEMNWRSVRMQTREGDLLVVPNLSLAGETLRSFDKPKRLHMERLDLGFSYADSPGDVKAAMLRVAAAVPDVLRDPAPSCFTVGYGDSSINYELRVWTAGYEGVPALRDAVLTGVWYEARRSGLTIPFPIRTTLNYDGDAVDRADRPPASAADFRRAEAFRTVAAGPLEELAAAASRVRFSAGEDVIPPGLPCGRLFVVLSGAVDLWVPRPAARRAAKAARAKDATADRAVAAPREAAPTVVADADRLPVGQVGPGDPFGSLGPLPADDSGISATAASECELLSVPSSAVRDLLDEDRALARELATLVEARRDDVRRAVRAARAATNGRV